MAGRIVSPELIGRENDVAVIAAALADAENGRARTILLGGEAGIGKSRVLDAALKRATDDGAIVLLGGSIGLAEGSLPFGPIVEAIRPLVRDMTATAPQAAHDALTRRALTTVAAELGLLTEARSPASAGAELRPEWARSRMYEAFLELLRRLADERPVVVAIEDLHWADDSTRELLAFLIRNAQAERLLLVLTFRTDELHRRHPLLFWLAEVDRSSGVERIELKRLDRDAVARQLSGILGRPAERSLVDTVYSRSDGNPFFAEELIAAGAETRGLPPTLREVLAARLALVSEPTMRLLGVASVVGRRVDHDLLADIADLTDRQLYDALQEAISAQLLVVDESAVIERYTFRHALIAEAAADSVLPGQRRRLHVAIAEALERMPAFRGAEEAGHLAEIAHHWFEGRDLGRASVAALRAAEAAFESSAFLEALRQYERALELWDDMPADAVGIDRVELLRRTAQAAQLAGEFNRGAHVLRSAIELTTGDADTIRRGLLHERLGRALWTAGDFEQALLAYRRAVELVPETPPSADLARVLAGYSQVLMLGGRYLESRPIAERALALAKETGARQIEGHAATTLGIDLAYSVDADRGIELIEDALAIAEEVGDFDDIGRSYACLSSALDIVGRLDEARDVAARGTDRLATLGMGSTYGAFIQMNAVDALAQLGRWDEGVRLAEAAAPVARGNGRTFVNQQLARLYALRGDLDAGAAAIEGALQELRPGAEAQFNGPLSVARIEHALGSGDIAAGREVADAAIPLLEETEDFGALGYLYAQALRLEAEAAERGRAARDDAAVAEASQRASRITERVRALSQREMAHGYRPLADLTIALGLAEASRVDGASDPEAWRRAAEAAEARPVVYHGAYARFRQAEALLASRGSRDAAASLLADARAVAVHLGARPLLELINGLSARARLVLTTPSADDEPAGPAPGNAEPALPEGVAGYELTARELEVLRLVAIGRTNRQIGDELFISESTAGVHVSRILAKLGVAGRVEAATIAARLGLAD